MRLAYAFAIAAALVWSIRPWLPGAGSVLLGLGATARAALLAVKRAALARGGLCCSEARDEGMGRVIRFVEYESLRASATPPLSRSLLIVSGLNRAMVAAVRSSSLIRILINIYIYYPVISQAVVRSPGMIPVVVVSIPRARIGYIAHPISFILIGSCPLIIRSLSHSHSAI